MSDGTNLRAAIMSAVRTANWVRDDAGQMTQRIDKATSSKIYQLAMADGQIDFVEQAMLQGFVNSDTLSFEDRSTIKLPVAGQPLEGITLGQPPQSSDDVYVHRVIDFERDVRKLQLSTEVTRASHDLKTLKAHDPKLSADLDALKSLQDVADAAGLTTRVSRLITRLSAP